MKTKLAISPIIATALLLVVTIVAVVVFQNWFATYSTSIFSKTENQISTNFQNSQIEELIGSTLYFKNDENSNITINRIKLNNVDCNYSGNMSFGITEINISYCYSNLSITDPEIVIYTNLGIYSKKFYVEIFSNNNNNSNNNIIPSITNILYGNYLTYSNLIKDNSNNVYVIGRTSNYRFYIEKRDTDLNYISNITYFSTQTDGANSILIDNSDNSIYVGGIYNWTFFIIKYNSSLVSIWNRSVNTLGAFDGVRALAIDNNDKSIYAVGEVNYNFFIIKYNSSGSHLWNKTIPRIGSNNYASSIAVNNNTGEIYVLGSINSTSYLIKYNASGTQLWNRTYSNLTFFNTIILDNSSNFYLSGYQINSNWDFLLVKYNSSGSQIWNRTYDSGTDDISSDIKLDSTQNIYITGSKNYFSQPDFYTIKYDSSGNEIWNVTYSTELQNIAKAIYLDSQDNIYVLGFNDYFGA